MLYNHRVIIVCVLWRARSWWLVCSQQSHIECCLLEVAEVIEVIDECLVIITGLYIIWTSILDSIIYAISTDSIIGDDRPIYIELSVGYPE